MAYTEKRYGCHNRNCRAEFDEPVEKGYWGLSARPYDACPKCGSGHIYDRWAAEDRRLKSLYKEYKKDALEFDVLEIICLQIPVMCIIWGAACLLLGLGGPGWILGIPIIIVMGFLFSYYDYWFDLLRFKGKIPRNMDLEGVTPRGYD